MKLYFHPVSAYSQKTLTAFYEKKVTFEPHIVNLFDPAARAEFAKLSPLGKVPLLVRDDGRIIPESTIIIEYLDGAFDTGQRLIPEDKELARITRFHDRSFDLYLSEPMQKVFFDSRKPEADRDPRGVASAKALLDKSLALLDRHFEKNTWANGVDFSMADCAAAPALSYLKLCYPFDQYRHVVAYAGRLFERPSFARVLTEAQPYLAKLK
jgi:glutathione S-transferase